MNTAITLARRSAERAMHVTHRQMARGLGGLATVAATAPFVGMLGTVWWIFFRAFPGSGAEKTTYMAIVMNRLADALAFSAWGLVVAIAASWFYQYLCARLADIDAEMQIAVRHLPGQLEECRLRP
jgi:biopolymer transport protein ExbB